MPTRTLNRWLLIRLAAQNLGRRRLRAVFLGVSVTLAVGVGFASFIAGWALRAGISTSFSRMGADLIVVPRGALVNLTSSLLTVEPTDETIDATAATVLGAVPGVARVAPQRMVRASVEGRQLNLIAFDPAADFTVLTWLREQRPGSSMKASHLLAGGRLPGQVGETLSVCGRSLEIYGRLGKTGVGPFDESYFVTFAGLEALVAASPPSPPTPLGRNQSPDHAGHGGAAAAPAPCLSGFVPGRVTAFLLQLAPNARAEQVRFAIGQLPDVKVVEGNSVLTSSRQAVSTLFVGIAVFTALLLLALLILVSLLFSAIVQERSREVGLLRAMGATPNQVMGMILAEAAMVTGLGGLAGLAFGASLLFLFARSLGYYFASLGVPFVWPPASVLELAGLAVVVFSAILGLVGALLPAWRVRRLEPYTLIHAEGR
jgi:putative ABC transport system permease protein